MSSNFFAAVAIAASITVGALMISKPAVIDRFVPQITNEIVQTHTPKDPYHVVNEVHKGLIVINGGISGADEKTFYNQTLDPTVREYRVVINTNGGDGFACTAIINRMAELQKYGVKFTTEVYGQAFSAGFFIYMMGDTRIMHSGSQLMIHTVNSQRRSEDKADLGNPDMRKYMIYEIDENVIRMTMSRMPDVDPMTLETMLRYDGMTFITAKDAYKLGMVTEYVVHY